jgi:multisubunit Na+/H+ antiporter MnhB subunit
VHDHGISLRGLASTSWPFAVGIGVGWLLLLVLHRPGTSLSDGMLVAVATVAVGMVLRVVSGQGTAVAFVLVAIGFLGALMVGWRAACLGLVRRRGRHGPA